LNPKLNQSVHLEKKFDSKILPSYYKSSRNPREGSDLNHLLKPHSMNPSQVTSNRATFFPKKPLKKAPTTVGEGSKIKGVLKDIITNCQAQGKGKNLTKL